MNSSLNKNHTESGIASVIIGGVMLAIQIGVLCAVFLGVRDSQGIIYAISIPFVTCCIGVPLGLLASVVGFVQPSRDRYHAKLGLALTLAGPLIFGAFFLVCVVMSL